MLHSSSIAAARRAAKVLTETIGFDASAGEEIALAITELATNLIKHAQSGKVTLTPLAQSGRVGVEIESRDSGPGMADINRAMRDGYSTAGTRGTGLGAINRLMDEMDITSEQGCGTRIVCRKWVRPPAARICPCPLAFGVATRPRQPDADNGDAFIVKQWADSALVGVIDGLGHGPLAHRAAQAARQYVESHFDSALEQIFLGTGRACRATRGVVMALARFDWGQCRLTFASLGNIEVRVFPHAKSHGFVIRRGVIGLNAPKVVVTEHAWPANHVLVLHSDGLTAHWGWQDFPGLAEQPATVIAQELLRSLAKPEDDATVAVIRDLIQ